LKERLAINECKLLTPTGLESLDFEIKTPIKIMLHTNRGYISSMDRDPIHGSNVSFMEDPNHGWQQISISEDLSSMDGDPIHG